MRSVCVEILRETDPRMAEKAKAQMVQSTDTVIKEVAGKFQSGEYQSLTDLQGNEVRGLQACSTDQIMNLPEALSTIHIQCIQELVTENMNRSLLKAL